MNVIILQGCCGQGQEKQPEEFAQQLLDLFALRTAERNHIRSFCDQHNGFQNRVFVFGSLKKTKLDRRIWLN